MDHISSPSSNDAVDTNLRRTRSSSCTSHTTPSPTSLFSEEEASRAVTKKAYFVDISRYLPLGVVILPGSSDLGVQESWPIVDWIEAIDFLPGRPQDEAWHIDALWKAQVVRIFYSATWMHDPHILWRIYILPEDVGRSRIDRSARHSRKDLHGLLRYIDISAEAWSGRYDSQIKKSFDMCATAEECSLYFMFNTIPSPHPDPSRVKDRYSRVAIKRLLSTTSVIGLKSSLYPYQRRSAAMMIQREANPELQLDPRLEERTAPDGQIYYYSARDALFLKQPRFYESVRGGILAESMGLGKTIICIAAILASKDSWPTVPPQYSENRTPVRSRVGTLTQMAAAATVRQNIPWRTQLAELERRSGEQLSQCVREMEKNIPYYEIPYVPTRFNRRTTIPPPQRIYLCSGTIIVVPRNLLDQWKSELQKHVTEGAMRILVMDSNQALPCREELSRYDIVLFSRPRFELEIKDGSDYIGRRSTKGAELRCQCSYRGATRDRDCHCFDFETAYSSPLKELHWLRLIVDEGHNFSSTSSNAVVVAAKLVRAERRWVVSGTPAKDLLGVDVELAASDDADAPIISREQALENRKIFDLREESFGASKSLGNLASHFLKIRPWADSGGEKAAVWDDYIYRHQTGSRTFEGFSSCFRRTLESMVVKTRPDDVEKDLVLPPLNHRIIRLEPSFYDKLTANIFVLVLAANAITSERTDVDYLFHQNNRKPRTQLINNLRQSAFFWTGFSEDDVYTALKHSREYLQKEKGLSTCSSKDRRLLQEAIANAEPALMSGGWSFLSKSHELGLFLKDWPKDSVRSWSFVDCVAPALMGASYLLQGQAHVNRQLPAEDASAGLSAAGEFALVAAVDRDDRPLNEGHFKDGPVKAPPLKDQPFDKDLVNTTPIAKPDILRSSIQGEPVMGKRRQLSGLFRKPGAGDSQELNNTTSSARENKSLATTMANESLSANLSPRKKRPRVREDTGAELSPESPLGRTALIGTTSSKLSYLIDRITSLYKGEKILVFYEGDNIAWYIAQALEVLHITHFIYAKALTNERRSKYIVLFNNEPAYRVLLMDVKQAAHGLNISSASRVFFVNPVCRPNIEAQAIKRAHRIGQIRPVEVETLVLSGSIEEAMLERSRRMTRFEHLDAKTLEDDLGIRTIIQNARAIPVSPFERYGYSQLAYLQRPQQLFGRPGRLEALIQHKKEVELGLAQGDREKQPKRRKAAKRKDRADKGLEQQPSRDAPPLETTRDAPLLPEPLRERRTPRNSIPPRQVSPSTIKSESATSHFGSGSPGLAALSELAPVFG